MAIAETFFQKYLDRIKWVATPDGHQLSLRVLDPVEPRPRAVILCVHGLFSDGRFFLNSRQEGPGRFFLDHGYQVIVGELRGHGLSKWPSGKRKWNWSFDEYVQQDIPALINAVSTLHEEPMFVLAHSLAGYALLASLGMNLNLHQKISGVCVMASAVNDYSEYRMRKWIVFHFADFLSRIFGFFPSRFLRIGVSDEPTALMRQFVDWASSGKFTSLRGDINYWDCLSRVTLPVWAGVGSADRFHASEKGVRKLIERLGSRDKIFMKIGMNSGFSQDFDHVGVLRSRGARREILPKIIAWMDDKLDRHNSRYD